VTETGTYLPIDVGVSVCLRRRVCVLTFVVHSSQPPPTQCPTEDPFHARERERFAKEVPKEQAKRLHGMIAQHASADKVLVRKDSSSAVLVGLVRKGISNVCACALVQLVSLFRKDSSRMYVYVHLFLRNAGL